MSPVEEPSLSPKHAEGGLSSLFPGSPCGVRGMPLIAPVCDHIPDKSPPGATDLGITLSVGMHTNLLAGIDRSDSLYRPV